jgi:hypothetical protein
MIEGIDFLKLDFQEDTMYFKKLIFIVFSCVVILTFLWSCAGTGEVVVEKPEEKKEVEVEKEIAKAVEPEVEFEPAEWATAIKDAEVRMSGKSVNVPKDFRKYVLTLRALKDNKIEVYLEERGMAPQLLLSGASTLEPDKDGKIAFQVAEINEEQVKPIFDVLGLRVLRKGELRDNYYLHGSLEDEGVSVLEAYDMNSSVTMKFSRK